MYLNMTIYKGSVVLLKENQIMAIASDSFFLSHIYRLMLYATILPLVYFIVIVGGGLKKSLGLSFLGVLYRSILTWALIVLIYLSCGFVFRLTMGDFGLFIDAKTGDNPFIRFYPVGVFIIAVAGFYYPSADIFNKNRTRFKRVLLLIVCFIPLYLMLVYMFFVDSGLWGLCLKFGIKSSMLALVLSVPIIFYDASDSLSLAFALVMKFLLGVNLRK